MNDMFVSAKKPLSALVAVALVGVLSGCERRTVDAEDRRELAEDRTEAAVERNEDAVEAQEDRVEANQADAENTGKNVRDRDPSSVTPFDQKENETDRTITQTIRQGVVGADGFSMDARNVKIVTADGVVTLRGPVDNDQERMKIVEMAKATAGVKRVDDHLEVARD